MIRYLSSSRRASGERAFRHYWGQESLLENGAKVAMDCAIIDTIIGNSHKVNHTF